MMLFEAKEIWSEKFGFCGCGCPEDVLALFVSVLEILDSRDDADSWKESYDALDRLFAKNDPMMYIVLYTLDRAGLTEHGTGVKGSWLSEKGRGFLEFAKRRPGFLDEELP